MANEEKRQALEAFVGSQDIASVFKEVGSDLNEALYSMSELRLWPDSVDSVSPEQAFTCWKLIERLRSQKLPDNLKM